MNYNKYSKDIHTIIDNLSKEESNHIGNGYWVDSNHIIYRKVEYMNNKPVGFIDVYSLPKFKRYGLIIIAVSKEARGKGIGKKLVNSAIQNCKNNKDIDKLRWLADSNNIASINMAKSLGFKLNNDGQDKKEFIYDLRGDKNIHDNDLIKKEYTDIEEEISINESSEPVFTYKEHYPDDKEYITESIIFNTNDIYYNKDKFDSGEINLCFITGFSGSGKSTMANKMEKNGIEKYELDDLVFQFNFSDDNLKEYGGMIYSFFNGPGKKYRKINGYEYFKTNEEEKRYEYNICIDFIDYAKKYASSHKDKKFVVEGVEILTGYIDKFDSLKNYAIYVKGTSFLNSYIRVAKREALNEEKSFDKIKTFVKLIFHSGRFKHYIDANSSLNKIKNKINNYTNESNDYITESPDKSSLSKEFKVKPNNIQYKILPLNKPEIYDYIGKYNRRRILLTSTGFTNKNIEKIFIDNIHKPLSDVKVIFVPTAANDPESKSIIPDCYKDLTNAGISDKNIMWYDLDRQMNLSEIMAYDAIYFCGGSEKYLIKRINQINFEPILISAINNGIFFIGVSAGSMIVSDSVKNGLGIIKNKLEPHCEKNIALNGNINLNDNTQIRLSDNQALWIYGDRSIIVESCKDVETARKFLQEVDNLSKKYDANFFIVTDGASMTRNGRGKSEPAVKNARDKQTEWEKKNGGNPDEDWLKHINESTLPSKERRKLDDDVFGIPSLRKYPLNDKAHVLAAIRMFNRVDRKHEKELAHNIIAAMEKYKISKDIIGPKNRLQSYI